MGTALSSLGPILFGGGQGGAGGGGLLGPILGGAGLIGNIMTQQKQNQALNKILYYQKNPAAASQVVNSLTQPLSLGLTEDVGNNVQGYLGERGLAESPNITASVLGQALAPYQQQNQQLALQEFLGTLNPAGAGFGQPANLGGLMSLFRPTPSVGGVPGVPGTGTGAGGTQPTFPYPYGGINPNPGSGGLDDSPIDDMSTYG